MSISTAMPVMAKNAGDWYGTYRIMDEQGQVHDQHLSHLTVSFTEGADDYSQVNRYTWADGRSAEYHFVGTYRDGAVHYDNDRISGRAWEADDSTIVLRFVYKSDPAKYIYEYIHISADGQHRTRIWHWFNEQGEVYKRTLIKEARSPHAAG